MENKKTSYPQYRKYTHGRTFFKITSSTEFEELQLMGGKCFLHQFKAKILPDYNFINDLTFDYQKHWEAITEAEYEEKKRGCSCK